MTKKKGKKSQARSKDLKKGVCPKCKGTKLNSRNRGICMKCRGTGKISDGR